jgi:hypothetical protein
MVVVLSGSSPAVLSADIGTASLALPVEPEISISDGKNEPGTLPSLGGESKGF